MTCYMRHMDWLFDELGLKSDKKQRQSVDSALRQVLEVPSDAHCPEIWASIKRIGDEGRAELVPKVAAILGLD